MAFVRQPSIFMSVAALAGVGWTLGASELWVAGQRAIPGWARGRMSAIVIMVSQGAIALGAVLWGFCGQAAGVSVALVVAAIALSVSLILTTRLSIDCTTSLSFDPPPISCAMSPLVYNPQPRDGPVAITFEFEVERPRNREFLRLMRELRLIHLRNGAFGWRLDEELTRGNTYRVELTVPSWTGYLLQRQRLTKAEQEIIKKVWGLHVGEQIPLERYYLCVNRELLAQVRAEAEPSIMSASPLDLGIPFKEFHEHRDE
jgi:Transmembrane secretion effector